MATPEIYVTRVEPWVRIIKQSSKFLRLIQWLADFCLFFFPCFLQSFPTPSTLSCQYSPKEYHRTLHSTKTYWAPLLAAFSPSLSLAYQGGKQPGTIQCIRRRGMGRLVGCFQKGILLQAFLLCYGLWIKQAKYINVWKIKPLDKIHFFS